MAFDFDTLKEKCERLYVSAVPERGQGWLRSFIISPVMDGIRWILMVGCLGEMNAIIR